MRQPDATRPQLPARILRAALDQADDAIVIADATGRIAYANRAIERHVGQTAAELVGRHFIVALTEGEDVRSYDAVAVTLGKGRSWVGNRVVRTADGLHIKVDLVVSPVRDDGGSITHVLAIARGPGGVAPAAEGTPDPVPAPVAQREPAIAPNGSPPITTPMQPAATAGSEIAGIIRDGAFRPTFQPIVALADRAIIGYEGLTRFDDRYSPEARFSQASACGLGIDLEMATLEAVLEAARNLPPGGFLSVNVSPALVLEGTRLRRALLGSQLPIVLEITERERVDDYAELRAAIAKIGLPLRWAIDDAGAGFASLRHILELRPQFVKLDRGLIAGIALDPIRQALAAGLLHFSHALGTTLVAEGVETEAEWLALQALGVSTGQGFLFGAPAEVKSRDG